MHEEEHSSEEDNDNELALLTKNFKKFLKKVGKPSKSSPSFPRTTKGKNPSVPKKLIFLTIKRGFNVRNVKVSGIFNLSVQTLRKKKNKALKSI